MTDATLDQVLDALDNSRQRATYGAVASLLGKTPRTLMRGRQRDRRHSWVVNRTTGRPTGYSDDDVHPELEANERLLETRHELEEWLAGQDTRVLAQAS